MTEELQSQSSKITKYKENADRLQEAIDSHQKLQQELQAKLQNEAKINAGKTHLTLRK